jgi:hypothetical protein
MAKPPPLAFPESLPMLSKTECGKSLASAGCSLCFALFAGLFLTDLGLPRFFGGSTALAFACIRVAPKYFQAFFGQFKVVVTLDSKTQ